MLNKNIVKTGLCFFMLYSILGCSSLLKGNFQMATKNYEAAIENYEAYILKNPGDHRAETKLGIACYKAGQTDKAIRVLEKVVDQKPENRDAFYYLGLAQIQKGDRLKAIQNLKAGRNPDDTIVQKEMNRQIRLLKVYDGLKFAEEVLKKEQSLQTLRPEENSVAVFYFKDISQDNRFKYLQKALASMIITDLAKVKSLQILERLRIHYLMEEMEIGASGIVEASSAPKAGRLLGAEKLVVGTLAPGSIVNKTGVASTTQNRVLASFSLSKAETEIFELQKEIVFNILEILKSPITVRERRMLGMPHTQNYNAMIYYGQGLDAEDRGNWKNAKKYYRKALDEDPYFLLAFWGYENCPAGSAPGVGELGGMSPEEITGMIEKAVGKAENQQSRVNVALERMNNSSSHNDNSKGSVSVGW